MEPVLFGLVCSDTELAGSEVVGGNPLDIALWQSPSAPRDTALTYTRLAMLPFDHERRLMSVLARAADGEAVLVVKGAPEAVLDRCTTVPDEAERALQAEVEAGRRVVAVGTRPAPETSTLHAQDEAGLTLRGFLVFLDPPKESASTALPLLERLGVDVKLITGDHPAVAARVFADLGLEIGEELTGVDLESMDDDALARRLKTTEVFARVSPEQKARIVRTQRRTGLDVAFLGDGVNDALALHAADVGISVDSATDVAKDAADVVLLEKDLHVLANGVVEGRRIFANTIKYVLMGTSSNFGNMFSAAGASAFLPFLPMLPSQILLNNLLDDTSQLAIPTDHVDPEQLDRPARWDIGLIRRFMLVFGPISSLFDFATFAVMLWVFDAGEALFHTGWFVESLATQTLVIYVIRTRRSPFTRSAPSAPLLTAALGVVALGAVLPATPFADRLSFTPLPAAFFLALVVMVLTYLVLVELGKAWFFRTPRPQAAERVRAPGHRVQRRASRFTTALSTHGPLARSWPGQRTTAAPRDPYLGPMNPRAPAGWISVVIDAMHSQRACSPSIGGRILPAHPVADRHGRGSGRL
jgi:Mg2+-importing ATPase